MSSTASWVPIAMLGFCGFCLGGVVAFVRSKLVIPAIVMAIAAALCGVAAWTWWK